MTDFFEPAPAAPAAPAAPWAAGVADGIVPGLLTEAGNIAAAAESSAITALANLANYHPAIPPVVVPTITATAPTNLSTLGAPPSEPGTLNSSFPTAPVEPVFGTLPELALPAEPEFNVTPPSLLDIPIPDPLTALVPAAPTLTNPALPVEPGFALPEVPTFLSLNLPTAPTLDLPSFDDVLGDAPTVPNATFAWAEVERDSALLSEMNSRLLSVVSGASTGLDPRVEAAIWNRGRDREAILTQRAIEEATDIFGARGHTMPDGVLLRVVQEALQASLARDASLSRDVMIKQAELEQSNFLATFNLAIQLESALIGHFNNVQNRAFEGQKFAFEAVHRVFAAQIQLRQAEVQAFGVKAQVFETRLKSKLAQLEVYKAELEGQRTVSEINRNQAALYQAEIDGVKALVEVYRSRVEAVKVIIEADKNRVDIHRAQIDGFDSQVKAKTAEYEGYGSRIRAEATKTEMYGQQVGAYRSRVDANVALVNAKLAEQTYNFRATQEFPLEVYKGRITAFTGGVQAEAARLSSEVGVFEAKIRSFATVEQAKHGLDEVKVEIYRTDVQKFTAQAQVNIQASIENIRSMLAQFESIAASLRAAAQIAGQRSAAALSARHISASIGSSTSNTSSNSSQRSSHDGSSTSVGNNANASWDMTKGTPTTQNIHTYEG